MLIVIQDHYGRQVEFSTFHPWTSMKMVKDACTEYFHVSPAKQRLFFAGRELKNNRTLMDYGISSGSSLFVVFNDFQTESTICVYGDVPCNDKFREQVLIPADGGLSSGLKPKLSMEGTGGTYFLRNRQKKNIAVFKAEDEEPFAPNNPRGYIGHIGSTSFRRGVLSGEGASREVAAYLLDSTGFFSVPATTRVEIISRAFESSESSKRLTGGLNFAIQNQLISSPLFSSSADNSSSSSFKRSPSLDFPSGQFRSLKSKVGALQEFVDFDDFAGDVASQSLPILQVQKIAVLDIRMVNLDRNEANILIAKRYDTTPGDFTASPSPALGFTIASSSPQSLSLDGSLTPSQSPQLPPSAPPGLSRLQARLAAFKSAKPSKPSIHLIPIDHSLTLPDTLELNWTDWCWLDWPQVKLPIEEEIKQIVRKMDPVADIQLLRNKLSIREECLLVMRISCLLLQKGVESGLSLYQIASLMCRSHDAPSDLEILCSQANLLAKAKQDAAKLSNSSHSNRRNSIVRPTGKRVDEELNELSLRRSVSHHDFRDCQVNENGFQLSEILSRSKRNNGFIPASQSLVHSHSLVLSSLDPMPDFLDISSLAQALPDEQQVEIFISCLGDLIQSAIERLLAKERLKQNHENQGNQRDQIDSRSLLSISDSSHSPVQIDTSPTIFKQLQANGPSDCRIAI
jgi:hypothetical protein